MTYGEDDVLVFGREDLGLEPEILAAYPDNHVSIPMVSPHVRSLNLAQCAAVGLYEAWRQRERTPPMRSDDDADEGTADAAAWLARVEPELALAQAAWQGGNAGKGRVASRRAAGMALKAWLAQQPRAHYGKNFMHHLNALADDEGMPQAEREAAWRLAA
ncbi:MAG: TrmH family RNA methyltransferase [bacterium]